jgi:glyoxylase-like metal-dependent hydrolase (beta-lactamase superfamily II)
MQKLRLGSLEIAGLNDIKKFSLPVKALFPEFDYSLLNETDSIDSRVFSDGLIHLTVRSWLLRHSGQNILIDSCVGANKNRFNHPAWHRREGKEWLQELQEQGLRPEDIDIVMCTHLHADHIGWNTILENGRWVPTFPNARYVCGQLEYNYWSETYKENDKHGAFEDSILPVVKKNQMEFIEDGDELVNGLTTKLSPGHTPGHLCLESSAGGIFCGDVVHSPLQLILPQLSSAFCSDPILARASRTEILNEVSEKGSYLIPAHFPSPGWTKIKKVGDSYKQLT